MIIGLHLVMLEDVFAGNHLVRQTRIGMRQLLLAHLKANEHKRALNIWVNTKGHGNTDTETHKPEKKTITRQFGSIAVCLCVKMLDELLSAYLVAVMV